MTEERFDRCVVETVALTGHALRDAMLVERTCERSMLIIPTNTNLGQNGGLVVLSR